jgi:hypothetical protein
VTVLRQFRPRLNLHDSECDRLAVDGASDVALCEQLRPNPVQMFERAHWLVRDGYDRVDDYRNV